MASYILLIILCNTFMCSFFFNAEHAEAALSQDEFGALKTFASKLGKVDWDFNGDPCTGTGFKGLACASVNGFHVTNITLPKLNLGGELSPELAKLTYLIGLDLSENGLTGPIPPQLGSMSSLRNLTLSRNLLSGPIPKEMGNLTSLVVLNIHSNYLSGTLPQEIGDLKNLQQLIIHSNHLSGTVPPEIGDLKKLNRLSIFSNYFSGTLPPEIGELENLENLYISSNQFIGEMPENFSKLVKLQEFLASSNNFTGKIPDFLGNFVSLETLMLQGTSMSGPIPSTLSNLTQLKYLRISDITQGGSSLDFILSLKNLKELVLRNNNITARIPVDIENSLQKLEYLDLSFNNLIGEIPVSFNSLPRLHFLFLGNNSFTGTIPYWVSQFQGTVDLSYNSLTGDMNGENSSVNLIGNFLTDHSSMSCLQRNVSCGERASRYPLAINCGGPKLKNRARSLVFDDDGQLSTSPFHLSPSKNWGVSNIGYYLEYFTAEQQMKAQYVVKNNITFNSTIDPHNNITTSSVIDPQLYMTARTAPISLRYYCLGLQNGPYSVELHFAEIQFEDTKTSKGLRLFDIYIQGIEVTKDFNIKEAAGGKNLVVVKNYTINVTKNIVEIHFFWAGKGTCCEPIEGTYGPLVSAIIVSPEFIPRIPKNKKPIKLIIIILAVTMTLGLLLILSLIFIKKTKRWDSICHIFIRDKELKKMKGDSFSLRMIKSATENFDPKNKIGEGGFGAVYKGALSGGTKVAIKQLSSVSRQGNREFLNEVTTISAVKHPNLVKLYGCCVEGDELLLVYEYIENGDLAQALFGTDEARVELDWPTRYRICLGVSRGLAYLHQESVVKIVHRDIKPTNILLDKNLNPKIADFGLARLFDEEGTHVSTKIAGTIGYLAPEYALKGHLSNKSDVYSFGVVVLEVISGRKHTDITLEEERAYLLEWSWHLYEENRVLELVDVNLVQSGFNEEEVIRMIHIGLLCTRDNPNARPAMSAVVEMMEGSMATPAPQSGPGYLTQLQAWELAAGILHVKEQSSTSVTSPSGSLTAEWKDRS